MWCKIKSFFITLGTHIYHSLYNDWITPLFIAAFFIAWTIKAFKIADFDLKELQGQYVTFKGAGLVKYGMDSGINSKVGQAPFTPPTPTVAAPPPTKGDGNGA